MVVNITEDDIHYKLVRNLIDIEKSYSSSTRRTGIYSAIENEIDKCSFETEKEGLEFKKKRAGQQKSIIRKMHTVVENSVGIFVAHRRR